MKTQDRSVEALFVQFNTERNAKRLARAARRRGIYARKECGRVYLPDLPYREITRLFSIIGATGSIYRFDC